MFKIVNLEVNRPTVDIAIKKMKSAIATSKKNDCILFIHGYGSTGKGGDIKIEAVKVLKTLLKIGSVSIIVPGEDFSITTGKGYNLEAVKLRTQYKELEQYAFQRNRGVTAIVV